MEINVDMLNYNFINVDTDLIKKILVDDSIFEEFKQYCNNMEKYSEKFKKNKQFDYLYAIIEYISTSQEKIDQTRIAELRELYNLYLTALAIIKDENIFKGFCSKKQDSFNNLDGKKVFQLLKTMWRNIDLVDCLYFSQELQRPYAENYDYNLYVSSETEENRLNFIAVYLVPDNATYDGIWNFYAPSYRYILNEEFEKIITSGVEDGCGILESAYRLYEGVNRNLRFSTNITALDADLHNPNARDIYNGNISQLSKENNIVVCKTWAETYAYLLMKNGWMAVVVGGKHKYVVALKNGYFITADATTECNLMTDMIRAKLGMAPERFKVDTNHSRELKVLKNKSNTYIPLELPDIYSLVIFDKNVNMEHINLLLRLIDIHESLSEELFNYKENNVIIGVLEKINWMNELLKRYPLGDNFEYSLYLKYLFKTAIKDDEKKVCILIINSLYRSVGTSTELEMVPIVSIYLGNPELQEDMREGKDYRFLIFKKGEHLLTSISRNETLEEVGSNRIIKVNAKSIPGLPELKNPQYGNLTSFFNIGSEINCRNDSNHSDKTI